MASFLLGEEALDDKKVKVWGWRQLGNSTWNRITSIKEISVWHLLIYGIFGQKDQDNFEIGIMTSYIHS